ncbi:MAG: chorismate synthase [Treponema sp.]|nr:chorismate synthase [Candidatus Treponema equifaecale]
MAQNTIGTIFKVTTFGESHGAGLGCIVDGVPAGIKIDTDKIQSALDRRKPGQSFGGKNNASVTARKEDDKAEILSGIFEGKSEGTPIGIVIRNTSQHSKDYGNLVNTFRPGHADYSFYAKYGFRDYRGGGRSSGRETAARVAAGDIARQVLEALSDGKVKITAYTEKAAGVSIEKVDFSEIEQNSLRAADSAAAEKMNAKIEEIRKNGDSCGGVIACKITGIPAGLGEPVFGKLDAELAKGIVGIGAVKGIEFGAGFDAADSTGSTNNDNMRASSDKKSVEFESNNAGGIIGGISNGNEIFFRVAVKPVPSIFQSQKTISVDEAGKYTDCDLVIEGRHDVCLCPRIVPVIEAMTAITLADLWLQNRASKI